MYEGVHTAGSLHYSRGAYEVSIPKTPISPKSGSLVQNPTGFGMLFGLKALGASGQLGST